LTLIINFDGEKRVDELFLENIDQVLPNVHFHDFIQYFS